MISNTKIKAQPFDCMQYFYGTVQKPLIRCYTRFNGHMNENALRRAINLSFSAVPLIGCCFDENHIAGASVSSVRSTCCFAP